MPARSGAILRSTRWNSELTESRPAFWNVTSIFPFCPRRAGETTLNVDWIAHLPAGIRRRAYFSLQRVIGSSIHAVWQEFKSWEYLSREELDRSVDTHLRDLLLHACQASPYYRQL